MCDDIINIINVGNIMVFVLILLVNFLFIGIMILVIIVDGKRIILVCIVVYFLIFCKNKGIIYIFFIYVVVKKYKESK